MYSNNDNFPVSIQFLLFHSNIYLSCPTGNTTYIHRFTICYKMFKIRTYHGKMFATTKLHSAYDTDCLNAQKYIARPESVKYSIKHNTTGLYMHCKCTQSLQREKMFGSVFDILVYLKQGSQILHHHWFRLPHPPCSGGQW